MGWDSVSASSEDLESADDELVELVLSFLVGEGGLLGACIFLEAACEGRVTVVDGTVFLVGEAGGTAVDEEATALR